MKVFISWSGEKSQEIARVFREWLPSVIQSIEPYVSAVDIDKGARWSSDIAKELENSTFGIICVTQDNIEAPWISFEAGALSKTMDKAFVTPFLFDIKRSEVQGPLLQFQSTVFEMEDIRKMIKTLNKACGDMKIPDERLNKSFDVWYPTLEQELKKIKGGNETSTEKTKRGNGKFESEILEEILELSRDNQKLLRTPDEKLHNDINRINGGLELFLEKDRENKEQSKVRRRYTLRMLGEIMDLQWKSPYIFLMLLNLCRDDFPWIYAMGKEVVETLESRRNQEAKIQIIREFRNMVDFTFNHPIMRDLYGRNKESAHFFKEFPYYVMHCIDALQDEIMN